MNEPCFARQSQTDDYRVTESAIEVDAEDATTTRGGDAPAQDVSSQIAPPATIEHSDDRHPEPSRPTEHAEQENEDADAEAKEQPQSQTDAGEGKEESGAQEQEAPLSHSTAPASEPEEASAPAPVVVVPHPEPEPKPEVDAHQPEPEALSTPLPSKSTGEYQSPTLQRSLVMSHCSRFPSPDSLEPQLHPSPSTDA